MARRPTLTPPFAGAAGRHSPGLMCINFDRAPVGYAQAETEGRASSRRFGRTAMFRNILVHIPSERPVRPVIEVAVALTMGAGRISMRWPSAMNRWARVGMLVGSSGAAVAAVVGAEQERAQERADAAISVFEVEAKLAKIAYGVRSFAAIPAEAGEAIGALARLYDMTIVLQPELVEFQLRQRHSAGDLVQFRRTDVDGSLHPQGAARHAPRRDRLGRRPSRRSCGARCDAVSDGREGRDRDRG